MIRVRLILAFIISAYTCYSQSISRYVISSGAKYASNSSCGIYANVGELGIQTYAVTNNILTEGFVQPPPPLNTVIKFIEPATDDYSIFPNPTSNSIQITTGKSSNIIALEIYDLQGRKVEQNFDFQKNADTTYTLNIALLDNGVYFIKFITSNHSEYKVIRLVKI